jgi:hypothetical protein
MSSQHRLITKTRRSLFLFVALFVASRPTGGGIAYAADDARMIVAEAQRRTDANSQRYEGVLQVFDAKGKISDRRWTFERLGSHGQSRAVPRFVAPAEVKGVLGEAEVDGASSWKIESTPKQTGSSQYTRSIVWIRAGSYAFARIENYVKDKLVRRLNYSEIQNIQGIWTARQLEMFDLTRGSRTRLTLEKLQYNLPLHEEDFTLQGIRRQ